MGLFDRFEAQWTPALFAGSLKKKPVGVQIAGERVALWRDVEGIARALIDRCPHRGVALSNGRVTDDGTLECPFHGWRYGADGSCVHIPFNDLPEDKRRRVVTPALPCREIGGMVWIFTSVTEAPSEEPDVPEALLRADVAAYRYEETWSTHWTRAMENMLDAPHLPIVHRRTIGRGLIAPARAGAVMEVDVEPRPFGFRTTWRTGEDGSAAYLDWRRPNGMVLYLGEAPRLFRQHLWCVPVDATRTRMMLVSVRGFGRYNPVFWLADRFNRMILAEDRRVVESSDPPEVPEPSEEASVASDRATLTFRRWYRRTLRARSDDEIRLDVA